MKIKTQRFTFPVVAILLAIGCFYSCEKDDVSEPESNNEASASTSLKSSTDHLDLAKRWAPIHYQDVDATGGHALSGKSDYITAINFDGDWVATNNWDNIADYEASAHVYYHVLETSTHWFITYAFFHPRDWENDVLFQSLYEHENDLEGVLMIVEKDETTYGDLKACVTVAHSDFYSYTPSTSDYKGNEEDIDGTLKMESFNGYLHPVTAQECRGHGLKAYPEYSIDGDGIIYYPSMDDEAQVPSDNYDTYVEYKLVDVFEEGGLWDQRYNTDLFKSEAGAFLSGYGNGNANAPWKWDDGDDTPGQGELGTNPAKLTSCYFKNIGLFSYRYTYNNYDMGQYFVEGVYYIRNQYSDKYLDVEGSSHNNSINISQYEMLGNDNQKWQVIRTESYLFKLVNVESGLVIDVENASTENGANVSQYEFTDSDHQKFYINDADNGYVCFRPLHSSKALDIDDWSTENGGNLIQWEYTGNANQQFAFEWVSAL